jgi:citronellol/citronellal dehydrogenase
MPYKSVFAPGLFKDQTIIVTGGGSGIGRCTAHELAALGANVVIVGRDSKKLEAVKAEIEEDDGEIFPQICDITFTASSTTPVVSTARL